MIIMRSALITSATEMKDSQLSLSGKQYCNKNRYKSFSSFILGSQICCTEVIFNIILFQVAQQNHVFL